MMMVFIAMKDTSVDVYDMAVNMDLLLPNIDEHGHVHINIPKLTVSEFATPHVAYANIHIVASAVYFHYWLKLISKDSALDRLCQLYYGFPQDCKAVGQIQYNYTHCLDSNDKWMRAPQYQKCPIKLFIQSLDHNGNDLAFGADILYQKFIEMDIHLEEIPNYQDDIYHDMLMRTVS